MTRIGLPFQAEGPVHIPCLNGKVHAAEGGLKVAISSQECGHQSPRLCVLREADGLNLETFGWAVSPPDQRLPKVSSPAPAYLGSGELWSMVIDVRDGDSDLTRAAET